MGMRTSSTRDLTMAPKAVPMMMPTARSTTDPFMANSLNSCQTFMATAAASAPVGMDLATAPAVVPLVREPWDSSGPRSLGLRGAVAASAGSLRFLDSIPHPMVVAGVAGARRSTGQRGPGAAFAGFFAPALSVRAMGEPDGAPPAEAPASPPSPPAPPEPPQPDPRDAELAALKDRLA